jgi:ribosomal-protein-alanine N-acetyltransferase
MSSARNFCAEEASCESPQMSRGGRGAPSEELRQRVPGSADPLARLRLERPCLEHLRLERLCRRHAPELQRIAADPRVAVPAGLEAPLPEQWAHRYCAWRSRAFDEREAITFAIVHRETVLGSVGIHGLDLREQLGEFAIWMARAYWGHGLAAHATRAVLRIGFEELGLQRVRARCATNNRRALRLLRHVGFDSDSPPTADRIRHLSFHG